jgi:hypothetical protein
MVPLEAGWTIHIRISIVTTSPIRGASKYGKYRRQRAHGKLIIGHMVVRIPPRGWIYSMTKKTQITGYKYALLFYQSPHKYFLSAALEVNPIERDFSSPLSPSQCHITL